jgi:GT2 family glycosyltransferase
MTTGEVELAVSVVIPTHNPRIDYLRRVFDALKHQTLAKSLWELVIVDNGSRVPLKAGAGQQDNRSAGPQDCGTSLPSHLPTCSPFTEIDLGWHPNARLVREQQLGLTFARLRGFAEAKGDLIVMVDDDNLLAPDYLETAVCIARERLGLGAFGGKCLPEFEVEPEGWLASVTSGLGLRDRGEEPQLFPEETGERGVSVGKFFGKAVENHSPPNHRTTEIPKHRVTRRVTEFPDCAPIGAGMVLRREAAAAYAERIKQRTTGQPSPRDGLQCNQLIRDDGTAERSETGCRGNQQTITDRKGDSLASGGDNDICLTVLEEGWQVGYMPQLHLTHLIPKGRMTLDYQKRMAREAMRSFILMLDQHGIRPWSAVPAWSVPLRVANDYVRVQPWKSPERLLKWCMNRGRYEACGSLRRSGRAADQKSNSRSGA